MKIQRFAQSTVRLSNNAGKSLMIDPGKYNLNPGCFTLENFPTADILIITHKHADHFDLDILKAILSKSSPIIFTNSELAPVLSKIGVLSDVVNVGDIREIEGFKITFAPADHVVRGEVITIFATVIESDGKKFYHASDTRFIDPSLMPQDINKADCVMVPISNRGVVMGIDDAVAFCSEISPALCVPIHYDSPKDKGRVDPNEFCIKATKFGLKAQILGFGQVITL